MDTIISCCRAGDAFSNAANFCFRTLILGNNLLKYAAVFKRMPWDAPPCLPEAPALEVTMSISSASSSPPDLVVVGGAQTRMHHLRVVMQKAPWSHLSAQAVVASTSSFDPLCVFTGVLCQFSSMYAWAPEGGPLSYSYVILTSS